MVNAQSGLKTEAFSKPVPGQVLLSLHVNFSTGSCTAITQLCIFVLKHGASRERRKALCKCYKNNGEVAAWLIGHFKAKNFKSKNKGVKVNTLEVNRPKHITDDRPSNPMEQMYVSKYISYKELF